MRIKIYACFLFVLASFSIKAQDPWVIADTMTSPGNVYTTGLISFKSNIYAQMGFYSPTRFWTSTSGNQGTWNPVPDQGLPYYSDFQHYKMGKTLDGGGYLYLGGWYGPNTDGQVYSSSDGVNWNLYLDVFAGSTKNITAYKGNGSTDSTYVVMDREVWKSAINSNDPYNASSSWRIACEFDSVPGISMYSGVKCSAIHNGKLYYGMDAGWGSMAQIVQTSDGINFTLDTLFRTVVGFDASNVAVTAMESFGGYLYVGFENNGSGTQIVRSNDDVNWELVNTYPGYVRVTDFEVAVGTMYVALENSDDTQQGKIERTTDGLTYIASTPDLFGAVGNFGGGGTFAVFNSQLYYGSIRNPYAGQAAKVKGGALFGPASGATGQIWRLCLSGTPPTIAFGNNNSTACSGTTINASVTSSATTYSWSNGSTTAAGPLNVPGTYTLTVTDAAGCNNSAQFNVNGITPPSDPYVTQNQNSCKGVTVVLTPHDGDDADFPALYLDGYWDYSAYTNNLSPLLSTTGDSVTTTIEFWTKPYGQGILLSEGDDVMQWSWGITAAEILSGDSLWIRLAGTNPMNLGHINLNTWNHVAIRYRKADSTFAGFLNGSLINTYTSVVRYSPIQSSYNTAYVLAKYTSNNMGSGYGATCQMRDFRFWTTARTDSEISSNMNTTFTAGTPGLGVYYKLNEGSGTTINDGSGNNIPGNFYQGPHFVYPLTSLVWTASPALSGTTGPVNCTTDSSITVTLTATAVTGCTSHLDYDVYVPYLNFQPSSPKICSPDTSVDIEINAEVIDSILWTPALYISDSTSSYVTVDPPSTMTYYVTAIEDGCHVSDSITVKVGPGISNVVVGPSINVCFGDNITLSATPTGGTAPYTYTWMNGWNQNPPFVGPVYNTGNINQTYSITVYVNVTDSIGCTYNVYQPLNVVSLTDLVGNITKQTGGAVTSGLVYLFRHHPGSAAYDSITPVSTIGAAGDYTYTGLSAGDYLIKAIADTVLYPDAWGTYYGNEYIWDSSIVYHHGCAQIDTANIEVIEVAPMTGTATISGYILEGPGFGQKLIGGHDHIMVPGGPIRGVDVKLGKNPGGQAGARTMSDSSGYYEFHNVDAGNYRIYVDIPNLPMDSTREVVVNAQDSSIHNDYFVDSSKVYIVDTTATVGIYSSAVKNQENFSVYPNPAKGMANLMYELSGEAQVSIEIYSTIGEKISSIYNGKQQAGKFTYPLDVKALNMKGGVYIVSLRTNNKVSTQRIVVIE